MFTLNPSHMALREKAVATFFIAGVAMISLALYDNRKSTYSTGKSVKLTSLPGLSILYRYVQGSTITAALGGCIFYSRVFLDIHDSTAIFYSGLTLVTIGTVLFVHAKLKLGCNYSPCYDSYLPLSVTATGIYRCIRHPIYVSNMIVLLGAFVMSGSAWIVPNIIVTAYFYYVSAIMEERELCRRLPGYSEYRERTGRFLPRLVRRSSPKGRAAAGATRILGAEKL